MISCDWLFKWKCFVSNKVSKTAMTNPNMQNEIRMSQNQRIGILPPGPISNHCLFVNEGMQGEMWAASMLNESKSPKSTRINKNIIKHNLVNEKDYKTVKKEVWDKFSKIYGGGPAIIREKPYIYSAAVEEKSPITLSRQRSIDHYGGKISPR